MPHRRTPARRATLALVLSACTAPACADPAVRWTLAGGLAQRTLQETANGARLLTERGPVASLQLQGERSLPDGSALALRLGVAGGDLHYDGRTSLTLAPFTSTTRHLEGQADLLWRPLPPARWGEAWLSLGLLANRRLIAGAGTVAGLDETSAAVLAGGLWRSPSWTPRTGWTARLEAQARLSAWHQVDVAFGGLYDATQFTGAQRRQLSLQLQLAPDASPWTWGLQISRIGQGDSPRTPLRQNGAATSLVAYQPALWTRDIGLQLSRRF